MVFSLARPSHRVPVGIGPNEGTSRRAAQGTGKPVVRSFVRRHQGGGGGGDKSASHYGRKTESGYRSQATVGTSCDGVAWWRGRKKGEEGMWGCE
jgi:hypothetical protein